MRGLPRLNAIVDADVAARAGVPGAEITGAMIDEAALAHVGTSWGLAGTDLSEVLDPWRIVLSRTAEGGAAPQGEKKKRRRRRKKKPHGEGGDAAAAPATDASAEGATAVTGGAGICGMRGSAIA